MNRFGFLGASAAFGSLGAGIASAQATPTTNPVPPLPPPASPPPARTASQFFKDGPMNFIFLIVLGGTYYGVGDAGTLLTMVDQVEDGNSASAYNVLVKYGMQAIANGDAARAAGHRASARGYYLQGSNYVFAATYFCDGMGAPEKIVPAWQISRNALDKAFALFDYPVEHIKIPYQGTTLPGYFLKPVKSNVKRPLFIMANGSDGSVLDMWVQGGQAAIDRGYNVLIFDGPGQGAALWLQHLYFRPDYEKAVTPVVDYALKRSDVDPKRIALQGISQGGYWAPRAMAFEHRIAAGIADPGVYDISKAWYGTLPPQMTALLSNGSKDAFNAAISRNPHVLAEITFRARPFGKPTLFDTFIAAKQYTLDGLYNKITAPLLITDPEDEQFFPNQPRELYNLLPGTRKAIVPFTVAEGANHHCEPAAPGLRNQKCLDWLDTTLGIK